MPVKLLCVPLAADTGSHGHFCPDRCTHILVLLTSWPIRRALSSKCLPVCPGVHRGGLCGFPLPCKEAGEGGCAFRRLGQRFQDTGAEEAGEALRVQRPEIHTLG